MEHPFIVLKDAIWNSSHASIMEVLERKEEAYERVTADLKSKESVKARFDRSIDAHMHSGSAGGKALTAQEKESYDNLCNSIDENEKRKNALHKEIEDLKSRVNKGHFITLPCTKVTYEQTRDLLIWMFGINNFAWRWVLANSDSGSQTAEEALDGALINVFKGANNIPEWIWNVKLTASRQSFATRLIQNEDNIASRFLETCLPRVGEKDGRNWPSREDAIRSISDNSPAAALARKEEDLYIKLEQGRPQNINEGEWTLRIFKRMLPLYIIFHTNPLYDLDFWDDVCSYDYVAHKMSEAHYSRGKGTRFWKQADFYNALIQSFDQYNEIRDENGFKSNLIQQGIAGAYETQYPNTVPTNDRLESITVWDSFPASVKMKAALIWNTIVPAAMDNPDLFLRGDVFALDNTPDLNFGSTKKSEERAEINNNEFLLNESNMVIIAIRQSGNQVKSSVIEKDVCLSLRGWKDIVFLRGAEGLTEMEGEKEREKYKIISIADFATSLDSRMHCIIKAEPTPNNSDIKRLVLVDNNSNNGTVVLRNGIRYVIGLGGKGNRFRIECKLAQAKNKENDVSQDGSQINHTLENKSYSVEDNSGDESFVLKRGDRIILGTPSIQYLLV